MKNYTHSKNSTLAFNAELNLLDTKNNTSSKTKASVIAINQKVAMSNAHQSTIEKKHWQIMPTYITNKIVKNIKSTNMINFFSNLSIVKNIAKSSLLIEMPLFLLTSVKNRLILNSLQKSKAFFFLDFTRLLIMTLSAFNLCEASS